MKNDLLLELQKPGFPDLKLLFSPDALRYTLELLRELLGEEKEKFETLLKTPQEEICFETFDDESLLDYYFSLLEHYQGVNNDEQIREIIETFEPEYIDFGNEVAYSKPYYEMLKYCAENSTLDSEQSRIITEAVKSYELRGIALGNEQQSRLKEISKKLAELSQSFGNNILDDQKNFSLHLQSDESLQELPEDDLNAAAKRATDKGLDGYVFDASIGSYLAIMKYCSDSQIREKMFLAKASFASRGEYDNSQNVLDILSLRAEKAKLLGFDNFAQLSLEKKMARSPEEVIELFEDICHKAKPKAREELDEIQEHFGLSEVQIHDLSYYARKLKEEKYALDDRELKKYFEFDAVKRGMFEIVTKLYGIEMKRVEASMYDEDVELYEVSKNGEFVSYFFTDFFYRPLKRQGAWANILRSRSLQNAEQKKIVLNVCNFQKASDGPTLLTYSDVDTMFHEFGHAIHEILSSSKHSELSGFHVEWDFVELPSQLLENWCRHEDGLALFARHYETGEKIPELMLVALKKLERFGTGQFVLRQNEFAMFDMKLHAGSAPNSDGALRAFARENYEDISLFPYKEEYSQHLSFSHIFDGGYAAGYYSYMWAEIIEKQVWRAFVDSGDIFSPEVAARFHDCILSRGSTKPASELFYEMFGSEVSTDAFLQEKGLMS